MTHQTLLLPRPSAVARPRPEGRVNGHHGKPDTFFIFYAASVTQVRGMSHAATLIFDIGDSVPVLRPAVFRIGQRGVAADSPTEANLGAISLESQRSAAIRTFRGGASLLLVGGLAAVASFVVATPFLPGISAALTVIGGLVAAGATEQYRRVG